MLPILENYSTVIALITKNEKHYSKKMFILSFAGYNEKISTQVQKGNEANIYIFVTVIQ